MDFQSEKPIYIQVAEMVEREILKGNIKANEQVPSTTYFTKIYQINPATSMKGLNLLVEEGILYKKRGLGFFVSEEGKELVLEKRRKDFFEVFMPTFIKEIELLELDKAGIIEKILDSKKEGNND